MLSGKTASRMVSIIYRVFVMLVFVSIISGMLGGCTLGKGSGTYVDRRERALRSVSKFDHDGDAWTAVVKGLALLWLEEDIDRGNQLLRNEYVLKGNFVETAPDAGRLYWALGPLVRAYGLFSKDSGVRGALLDEETETAIIEVLWKYLREQGEGLFDGDVWRVVDSENHDIHRRTVMFLTAQFLKDKPEYRHNTLPWGQSIDEFYIESRDFLDAYLTERARSGLFIEVGSPHYQQIVMQSLLNLRDFSNDYKVAHKAEMLLDVIWIDHAVESIKGIRGGAKSRLGNALSYHRAAANDGFSVLASLYFDFQPLSRTASENFQNVKDSLQKATILMSDYVPPEIAKNLMTETEARGSYAYVSRRPGIGVREFSWDFAHRRGYNDPVQIPLYYIDPEQSVLRYTYVTPEFVMGSFIYDDRNGLSPVQISTQNQWEGVIFKNDIGSRIFAHCVSQNPLYEAFWTMQHGPIIITQLSFRTLSEVLISISRDLTKGLEIDGEWVFGKSGDNAFFAFRAVSGGLSARMEDGFIAGFELLDNKSPIIIHAGTKDMYGSFKEFKDTLKGNSLEYNGEVVSYTDKVWGKLQYGPEYFNGTVGLVNGEPIDYEPELVLDSPYLKSEWKSGVITASFGDETIVFDFTE